MQYDVRWNDVSPMMRPIFRFFLGRVLRDKEVQEKLYFDASDDLEWTIVRPGGLQNQEEVMGQFQSSLHLPRGRHVIGRKDTAHFILSQISSKE